MGLTEEEVREVMHIAMSVGASRVQVMADAELAKLASVPEPRPAPAPAPSPAPESAPEPASTLRPESGFVAATVEAQADGG